MKRAAYPWIVILRLGCGVLPILATPSQTSPAVQYPDLVIKQEQDGSSTRVRAYTIDMNILTKGKRSLALRLECNHPTDQIKEPDICVVYIVSESTSRRYPNHDTSFKAIVDGASVSDSPFKNYKETQVGDKVVVPLLSIWKWEVVKKVASGTKIVFVLDGEKIQLPQERLGPIRQMVSYFEGKGA